MNGHGDWRRARLRGGLPGRDGRLRQRSGGDGFVTLRHRGGHGDQLVEEGWHGEHGLKDTWLMVGKAGDDSGGAHREGGGPHYI